MRREALEAAERWLRAKGWRVDRHTLTVWRWHDRRFPAANFRLEDALELMRYDATAPVTSCSSRRISARDRRSPS